MCLVDIYKCTQVNKKLNEQIDAAAEEIAKRYDVAYWEDDRVARSKEPIAAIIRAHLEGKKAVRQIYVVRFVYVSVREWYGIDIDGVIAIPADEYGDLIAQRALNEFINREFDRITREIT